MFLVTEKKGSTYGVLDTSDGVTEYLTRDQIFAYRSQGVDIAGVTQDGRIYILNVGLATLWYAQRGVPLKVRFPKDFFWKQLIFMGCTVSPQGKIIFQFFDSSGLFGYSSEFLIRSEALFNFNNNDPELVAKLIAEIKKMS